MIADCPECRHGCEADPDPDAVCMCPKCFCLLRMEDDRLLYQDYNSLEPQMRMIMIAGATAVMAGIVAESVQEGLN